MVFFAIFVIAAIFADLHFVVETISADVAMGCTVLHRVAWAGLFDIQLSKIGCRLTTDAASISTARAALANHAPTTPRAARSGRRAKSNDFARIRAALCVNILRSAHGRFVESRNVPLIGS